MPRAYPSYPFVEPQSANIRDDEIDSLIADVYSQNPQLDIPPGGPLDALCRALTVDVEYSAPPNDILLEVPLDRRPVIWLPKNGKPRHDRLATATGVGHWLIHAPRTRQANPMVGLQALYKPTNRAALEEARRFALAFLMPADRFTALWYEGKATLVAEELQVPTQAAYDRAARLDLSAPQRDDDPVLSAATETLRPRM